MKTQKSTQIKNNEIPKLEKQTIVAYLLLTIPMIWILFSKFSKTLDSILIFYAVGTQLFLYFFKYRALRNIKTFLLWVGIGVVHLCLFLSYRSSEAYNNSDHYHVAPLRHTLILLGLYQLLRVITKFLIKKDLVMPTRSGMDLYDERKITWVDSVCLVIYFFTVMFLNAIGDIF